MNIVFPALVLFAFVLPGQLFRFAYNKGEWTFPLGRLGPIAEQIPRSLVHAAWLNALWAAVVHGLHRLWPQLAWPVDYPAVAYWLTNNFGHEHVHLDRAVRALTASPTRVFLYFLGLYAVSWLAGWGLYVLVRRLKWDRYYPYFRFENDWHYQFRGEILDFPDDSYNTHLGSRRSRLTSDEWSGTVVAAVVDFKETSLLYLGILVDFFFDQSGNLERILLEGARVRPLTQTERPDYEGSPYYHSEGFREIKGHYFVLRMSELKTINFDYISKDDIAGIRARAEQESEALREEMLEEEVRGRAYALWERLGRPEGRDEEIWHRAEAELDGRGAPGPGS